MFSYTKLMQAMVAAGVVTPTDPYFNLVTLLLPGNGTNGAQNNTFLDSSTNNFSITRNGNTTQGTFSPFSQTGWGNFFDGSGDFLTAADNTAFQFGTGTLTVEFWYFPVASLTNAGLVDMRASNSSSAGLLIRQGDGSSSGTQITCWAGNPASTTAATQTGLNINQWNHVAVVRDGSNNLQVFVNGSGGTAVARSINLSDQSLRIAAFVDASDSPNAANGYISNLRITKGGALYTSTFTPSTTPLTTTVSAGTVSLLTCQSNRFIDNSTNAFAITVNGTPSVQAFSPFAPTAAYSAATNGGSGYFDGSGDYLSAASNTAFAFGTGDFTWEAWLYRGASATQEIYTTIATNGFLLYISSNKAVVRQLDVADRITSSADVALNTWTHIAVARSGTTMSLWLNGSRTDGGTATNSNDFAQNGIRIGISANTAFPFTGYISGMRVVKGTAVYDPTQTSITVPTAPPTAVTNTQLLTNFTNAGITDATAKNDLETVGNASISTTQSKFGGSSMYFDGTGDYLLLPSSENLGFGTGDFTIEGWLYLNATSAYSTIISNRADANDATTGRYSVAIRSSTFEFYSATGAVVASGTVSTSTWTHFAVTRASGSVRLFLGGTQQGSTTSFTTSLVTRTTSVGANNAGTEAINAYIDDLRITKGYARYTANFTVTTTTFPLQ